MGQRPAPDLTGSVAVLIEVPRAEHDLHTTHPDAVATMVRAAVDADGLVPHR